MELELERFCRPCIPDTIPSTILERYCYTVSYNSVTSQPNWVMWQLTEAYVQLREAEVQHREVQVQHREA